MLCRVCGQAGCWLWSGLSFSSLTRLSSYQPIRGQYSGDQCDQSEASVLFRYCRTGTEEELIFRREHVIHHFCIIRLLEFIIWFIARELYSLSIFNHLAPKCALLKVTGKIWSLHWVRGSRSGRCQLRWIQRF